MPDRFQETRANTRGFERDGVLVKCPHCGAKAHVHHTGDRPRFSCAACGRAREDTPFPGDPVPGGGRYFGLDLWLRADFRGHLLWALNHAHLDYLRRFVAAGVRERDLGPDGLGGRMPLGGKLPAWLTSAKNREGVLRALDRLRGE